MDEPTLVYCKHMDAETYEGTCAMCTPPEPEPRGFVAATMHAQYETACDACDKRIHLGELIALVDGAWIHNEHTEVSQP